MIARLKKERDEARSLLAQAERQMPLSSTPVSSNAAVSVNGKRGLSIQSSMNMDFHQYSGSDLSSFYIFPVNEDEELGPDGKKIRRGISATVISELTDCNAALSQQRKKRQVF